MGRPAPEPFATVISAYSPYDNTGPAEYPAIYTTAGLNDPRVSVHEPAKWTARLRSVHAGDAPILLRTEMGAGHGGRPAVRRVAGRGAHLAFILATT